MRTQADAAKKAKAHANKKGKKVRRRRLRDLFAGAPRLAIPQAVSKRAPKKKKTYDSDEESDGYDDDSEDDWGAKQKKKAPAAKPKPKPKPVAKPPPAPKAPPKAKAGSSLTRIARDRCRRKSKKT